MILVCRNSGVTHRKLLVSTVNYGGYRNLRWPLQFHVLINLVILPKPNSKISHSNHQRTDSSYSNISFTNNNNDRVIILQRINHASFDYSTHFNFTQLTTI
ncbi:hypothetical protein Hdeb2414_s0001g00032531 [Helianthus debilis subsp. tardiflorus]